MTSLSRAVRHLALFLPLLVVAPQLSAQQITLNPPTAIQTGEETPWIYEGSDVPQDREWLFGEMDNGLRYAVRENGVPPGQVSIRIRIDAGSLHERDDELGFAHLLEHLLFRESKYLGPAEAIPTWQRLGATFGSDTNASTTPTQTVYKLDLPNASPQNLEESFKLLSGMIREPVLSAANLAAEVPIVLAEKRESGGPEERNSETSRKVLFAGQRFAERPPIGTEATLTGATPEAVQAFHARWYRPENTVIAVAGDVDPMILAALTEKWFGDWQVEGPTVPAPDFGDPVPPPGATGDTPIGETGVLVEPGLPRAYTYAIMRPWRQVEDTIVYNEGKLRDELAAALINRRLEARARGGGSFLYAYVQKTDFIRSTDATFVSIAPLTEDWQAALSDVRSVIADALAEPPTQEELDRELAEMRIDYTSMVEQRSVMPGSGLADMVVGAVDIRESVAAPETFLQVFNSMKDTATPQRMLEQTRAMFEGSVIRSFYVTPAEGEATEAQVRTALAETAAADANARLAAQAISFDDLPAIGEPGTVASSERIFLPGFGRPLERVEFDNGVTAFLSANGNEPGRVAVKVRFGAGYRAFEADDAPYISLGQLALFDSGIGELGQEEIDRLTTGRRIGHEFAIDEGTFVFAAQTRGADLADQLYLLAAKLGMPSWDPNPVIRARALAERSYESWSTSPQAVLGRDLDYLLRGRDPRFATPDPATLATVTPEGFRQTWEPLLSQGPVEVMIFGQFDRDEAVETLRRTFGALSARDPVSPEVAARAPDFPSAASEPVVLTHKGDANQAAAVIAWPGGAGTENLRESRQLEILMSIFNNRLIDEMREHAGASYAPQIGSSWPLDLDAGGTITATSQLQPEDVPLFFEIANGIAQDLATEPADADELARATEPLLQLIDRASTGNLFWMFQVEGAGTDPRRLEAIDTLLPDYTRTTPEAMQALARKYFAGNPGWRLAVIPEGQTLASGGGSRAAEISGR